MCKRPVKDPALRLFCFPYAGGGVSIYRHWAEPLPRNVEVQVLEMPGRETRLHEPPFVDVDSLVRVTADAITPYLHQPFVFFGHSMGALVSFELARLLRQERSIEPRALFVSAHPTPQVPIESPTYNLPEKEFIEDLRKRHGTPDEVLAHSELLQLLIPTLRADFQLCQTYQYKSGPPLKCEITAFGGLTDPFVSREALEQWREQTTGPFQVRMFPGDHFFLHSSQTILLDMLSADLDRLIRTRS